MPKAELYGNHRIADSAAAYEFLNNMFEDKVKKSETYFAAWFPYKIKRAWVKYLPIRSIPQPFVDLEDIKDTLSNYLPTGDFHVKPVCKPLELVGARTETMPGTEYFHLTTRLSEGQHYFHAKKKTSVSIGVRRAPGFCSSSCRNQKCQAYRVTLEFCDMVGTMRKEKVYVVKCYLSFGTQTD